MRQVLQSVMDLLQIATGITKCDGFITNCDRYYKVRWLLQIATVQTSSCKMPSVRFYSCKLSLPEQPLSLCILGGRLRKVLLYNPGEKSLGQCHTIVVPLQNNVTFSVPPSCSLPSPYTMLKLGKNSTLTDPEPVSRVGRKGRTKVFKYGRKAPGYRISSNYFQKFKRMQAPDWAQKMLCIIVPNRRTVSPEFFS